MENQLTILAYLPVYLIDLMPWIIVGLLLAIALLLFFFLIIHRRNNLRRFSELEEKIIFFHPSGASNGNTHPDLHQLTNELNKLKEKVDQLQKLSTGMPADSASLEKIELFKKGIHQHLNELHERIKLNEINTNRMLHYLEDLRETLSQSEE
ncbi:MAG TPA: hypothetical protein PKE03_08555 [Bacteroidales bacterium]|nr:hypothetical protein [Bacteroidales bacterium]